MARATNDRWQNGMILPCGLVGQIIGTFVRASGRIRHYRCAIASMRRASADRRPVSDRARNGPPAPFGGPGSHPTDNVADSPARVPSVSSY